MDCFIFFLQIVDKFYFKWRKKKYLEKKYTDKKNKNGGNAFNDRETGLGISRLLHQAHAKWFQVSQCDQEKVWSQKGK